MDSGAPFVSPFMVWVQLRVGGNIMWRWPPGCGHRWQAAPGPAACGCGWTPPRGWMSPTEAWLSPSADGRCCPQSARCPGCGCSLCPPGHPSGTNCRSPCSCLRTSSTGFIYNLTVPLLLELLFYLFLSKSRVELTRVWLVEHSCGVREVLQNFDPGVGEVSGKQRHDLNLHLLSRSCCHWHGHQPRALPTHCPVAVAVSHWGDKHKQGHAEARGQRETKGLRAVEEFCKVPLLSLRSTTQARFSSNTF